MAMFKAVERRQLEAVRVIQRVYRGARGRRVATMAWVRQNAGTVVRSCAMRWCARRRVDARRVAFNGGALTLQRSWRGSCARGRVAGMRHFNRMLSVLQCTWRASVALRRTTRQRRRRQEAARRHAECEARRLEARRRWAVTMIEAVARGRLCRLRLARARAAREKAAAQRAIARMRRNVLRRQRRRRKAEFRAACVIQTHVRGWQCRSYLQRVRAEIHRRELEARNLALKPKVTVSESGASWCPLKNALCHDCGAGQFCKQRVRPLSDGWTYQQLLSNAAKVPPLPDIEDL